MEKRSSRHHLVPEFLLKKFTGPKNKFYVYDKSKDKIFTQTKSPKQVCFIWDRNTVTTQGVESSFIEDKVLSGLDHTVSKYLDLTKAEDVRRVQWSIPLLYAMRSIILHIYWRSPYQDQKIEWIIENFPFSAMGLQFVDNKNGVFNDPELEARFKQEGLVRKMYQALIPISSIVQSGNISRWKFISVNPATQLISDFPIIHEYEPNSLAEVLENNLIMPVSNYLTITNIEAEKEIIEPTARYLQELLIIDQAMRHVCCHDKGYLGKLVDQYRLIRENRDWDKVRKDLFTLLK